MEIYISASSLIDKIPYGIAIFSSIITFVILYLVKKIIVFRIKKLVQRTKTDLDDFILDLIDSLGVLFYISISLYIGTQFASLDNYWLDISNKILILVTVYYASKIIGKTVDYSIHKYHKFHKDKELSVLEIIGKIIKTSVWFVGILIVLQNWGVDISALIAGMGIGGIAIAFAVQNILGDIFASFSIYFDKPFKRGDFIVIDNDSGTVEEIGLKSTRIRTLQGEELIISNKELTEARIHNYKRMRKRAVFFKFGIAYETSVTKLKKVRRIIERIFKNIKNAELSRVHFRELGDFALIYEVMYYVDTNDYIVYLNTQEEINIKLMKELEKEGIEFAYPTQKIFIKK